MPASEQLRVTIDEWLIHLEDKEQSEHTLAAQRYAITLFEQWLDARPEMIGLESITVALLTSYVNDTKNRPSARASSAEAAGQRLKHSTIHRYIDILVRWLQYLVNEGILQGIPKHRSQRRTRLVTPEGVRDTLKQLIQRNPPPVAPRMPDLSRLPGIYHQDMLRLQRRYGGSPPLETPVQRRAYLNLLRNRALVATIFCTGGRISEVLSLDTDQVMPSGEVLDEVRIVGRAARSVRCRWILWPKRGFASTSASASRFFQAAGSRSLSRTARMEQASGLRQSRPGGSSSRRREHWRIAGSWRALPAKSLSSFERSRRTACATILLRPCSIAVLATIQSPQYLAIARAR